MVTLPLLLPEFQFLQEPRGALVLLRKLLDCCPFPQAKGLLVDICRPLFLRLYSLPCHSYQKEFKRAPHQPKSAQDPSIPSIGSAVETKQALTHIQDMKNLESYHFKLDEYSLQYPSQDTADPSTGNISPVCIFLLDLFVFPSLRLISAEYQSALEAMEIVDWISSVVSLLRLLVMKQFETTPPLSPCSSTEILIWSQAMDLMRAAADNTTNIIQTLQQWQHDGASPSTSLPAAMRKYEMIQMNLSDTLTTAERGFLQTASIKGDVRD